MYSFAIIGLGYVGLGLAIALSQKNKTVGYDSDVQRISELQQHIDRNQLLAPELLQASTLCYTNTLQDIQAANFYIITVGTPAYFYELPNLEPLLAATRELASILKPGDIVVFESTVYPRTTEDSCIPLLEECSGLHNGRDFYVAYSPERINTQDKDHNLANTTKVVAAQTPEILEKVSSVYASICKEVYPVANIATAEAVKILENTQRDVNIALMNEFAVVMHALHLDTYDIIEAAKTKWSFVPFQPGLVGGHCISIDPLYLAFQAKRFGVQTDLVLAARKVNDGITEFILQSLIKLLIMQKVDVHTIKVGLFGIAFKANSLDCRNSLSLKLAKELRDYGLTCQINDPIVHLPTGNIPLHHFDEMRELSAVIILVGHDIYRDMGIDAFLDTCKNPKIVMDIPSLFVHSKPKLEQGVYWHL